MDGDVLGIAGLGVDAEDGNLHFRQGGHDFGHDARSVVGDDFHVHFKAFVAVVIPFDVDEAVYVILAVGDIRAVGAMDGDAAAAGDDADDGVARYRTAALGQADQEARFAFDQDARAVVLDRLLGLEFFQGCQAVGLFFLLLQVFLVQFQELDEDRIDGKAAVTDSGDQVVFGAGIHLLSHAAQAAADVEGFPVMAQALTFPFQRF